MSISIIGISGEAGFGIEVAEANLGEA